MKIQSVRRTSTIHGATGTTMQYVSRRGDLDEVMVWVLFLSDSIVARLANIKVWALQAFEADTSDMGVAEVANRIISYKWSGIGACWGRVGTSGLNFIAHGPYMNEDPPGRMKSDKLVTFVGSSDRLVMLRLFINHASVAIVEVRAV
jgi:hypothetical protein